MAIQITCGKEQGLWIKESWELDLLEPLPELNSWALTTYARCQFRCTYCITGAQGASLPLVAPDEITTQLGLELEKIPRSMSITVGSYTDAYPRVERRHRVTRAALELLAEQGRSFRITTKGPLVARDADLLRAVDGAVIMSLISARQADLDQIEQAAPSAEARLEALHELFDAGIEVGVSVVPWIPDIAHVASVIEAVDPRIPIRISPLRVLPPFVQRTEFGRRWTQQEINEQYVEEWSRWKSRKNVWWGALAPEASCRANLRGLLGTRNGDVRDLPSDFDETYQQSVDSQLIACSKTWTSEP